MLSVRIGTRTLGPGHSVYFIAEAGSNHDGNLAQARRLVEVAAGAGADAVKFQTFRADALYPRSAGTSNYLKVPRPIHDVIRDLEMPLEWIPVLAEDCARLGVDFLSTPFDERSADALAPFVPAFKIASYDLTHHALVQHCARKGKPLILSTGTADLADVREALDAFRAVGGTEIVLLQCTAAYPAPLGSLNLRAIVTMARELGVPVGLSDHSREPLPGPMAAVTLGAVVVEKHFTLGNHLPGPDHAYALEPPELAAVIARIREVERTLGTGDKVPMAEEQELRHFARRSLFTTRPVAAGEPLRASSMAALRCGKLPAGLAPRHLIRTLGRPARRDLPAEVAIGPADVSELRLHEGGVSLRPLDVADADKVVAWRSEPATAAFLFADTPPTREVHDAWYRTLQLRSDRLEFVILDGDAPVGTVGLSDIDLGARTAAYGILVGEASARGRGVAGAASRLLIGFAFEVLGLVRLDLELFTDNEDARALYDRLGFLPAEPRPPRQKGGISRSVTRMRLNRSAWEPGKGVIR